MRDYAKGSRDSKRQWWVLRWLTSGLVVSMVVCAEAAIIAASIETPWVGWCYLLVGFTLVVGLIWWSAEGQGRIV